MPRALCALAKVSPAVVLSLGAALWVAACQEPCRYDADCDASVGLTRCDVATGACEPLMPLAVSTCEEAADCDGGRVCAGGECRFAPSCQRVTDGAAFDYIARCGGGEVLTGTASAITNGCQIELTLDVEGSPSRIVLEPIPAIVGEQAEITTKAGSDVACAPGTWSAAHTGASLPGCSLPTGQTCDVGLLRQGGGPICLADGTGCPSDAVCEPVGNGAADVGGCR